MLRALLFAASVTMAVDTVAECNVGAAVVSWSVLMGEEGGERADSTILICAGVRIDVKF